MLTILLGCHAFSATVGWRNDGTGRYPDAKIPTTWGGEAAMSIVWKAPVGRGQSLPVIVGNQIFITAEPDLLIAVNAQDGAILWKQANGTDTLTPVPTIPTDRPQPSSGCGFSTATPVTDGKLIWTTFGTGVVVCYDFDGHRKWAKYIDAKPPTEYGRSVSPLLVNGKLLVSMAGLMALDPATGNTLWNSEAATMTYGTPVATKIGTTDVVITPHGDCVRVEDGKIIAKRLAEMPYSSPIVEGGVVYFLDANAVAYKLPEQAGEAVKFMKLWDSDELEGEFFASPVYLDGVLYTASNQGNFFALDARTGKLIFKNELPIASALGKEGSPANLYPSVALVGKNLIVGNDAGEAVVIAPEKTYHEIARNKIDHGAGSSPVAVGNRLYLRSGKNLLAIERKN